MCAHTRIVQLKHKFYICAKLLNYVSKIDRMKEFENIRIKDIAEMAGVSVGTVDRVLHNRGRVSEENLKKINDVLKQVNYHPNMIARSLASKKQYTIVVIIPSFEPGEYWESISKGIDKAGNEFEDYGVYIRKLYFDQYDNRSLDKAVESLFDNNFDAVLIASLFNESVINISRKLDEMNIPYNYIDSNIQEQNKLAYFGTDSFNSGAIGAKILLTTIGHKADILVARMINSGDLYSNQCIKREAGFNEFLKKVEYSGKVYYVDLKIGCAEYNYNALDQFFNGNNKIKGVIIFNSKCHEIASYIKAKNIHGIALVGYDVIEKNAIALKEGIISALIAQRPQLQGYRGVKSLCEYLILKKTPSKENYMPIDILIKENVDYYNGQ